MWRSENNAEEWVLSFHHVGTGMSSRREPGGKRLYTHAATGQAEPILTHLSPAFVWVSWLLISQDHEEGTCPSKSQTDSTKPQDQVWYLRAGTVFIETQICASRYCVRGNNPVPRDPPNWMGWGVLELLGYKQEIKKDIAVWAFTKGEALPEDSRPHLKGRISSTTNPWSSTLGNMQQ